MRLAALIGSFVFLAGCADPTYVREGAPAQDLQSKLAFDCSLQFVNSSVCFSFQWETLPTEKEPGSMLIRFFSTEAPDNFPTLVDPGKDLAVVLWMPSMGHGSSPVTVESVKLGTFRASNVYFVMPGEWEIKFQLSQNGSLVDEVVVPFNL